MQKFDFAEKFYRSIFEKIVKRNMRYSNGTIKKNCGGNPVLE